MTTPNTNLHDFEGLYLASILYMWSTTEINQRAAAIDSALFSFH